MTWCSRLVRFFLCLLLVTNAACASAIYVQPASTMTFQQLLEADASISARMSAHTMRDRVRGDERRRSKRGDELVHWPESYSLDGAEGMWASQFHLTYAATSLIRAYYAEAFPKALPIKSDTLFDIVDAADGHTDAIDRENRNWTIEIADIPRRVIFELVPPGETHRAAGKNVADAELMVLNAAMQDATPFRLGQDFSGEIGVRFAEGAAPWRLSWHTSDPGVVQFRWEAMTIAKVTEESCRDAYLKQRWHDVTLHEMTKFGAVLHEVVERLVLARDEMGQAQARAEMPLVPGKTVVDYLDTVALWSAHDEQRAQFLPVMHGPTVEVVPAKQFVGETLAEGTGGDAEGVYDLKGKPGRQPDNLHMGNSAHILLAHRYKVLYGRLDVFTNTVSIATIVQAATDNRWLFKRDEALLRPDIADVKRRVVFEIKSRAPGRLAEGQVAVAKYIAALNQAMPTGSKFTPGTEYAGNFWVRFNRSMPWWRIEWDTTAPGVVQYKWQKLNNEELDPPTILAGVQAGRYVWVDLTDGEMQQHGQEFENDARKYVGGAEILYKSRLASGLVVEVVGHAAMVYLSPGLSANSHATAKGAAQSAQSVPRVRVGVEPTPKTRVPASPAPEPVGEPEVFPDVAARRKM